MARRILTRLNWKVARAEGVDAETVARDASSTIGLPLPVVAGVMRRLMGRDLLIYDHEASRIRSALEMPEEAAVDLVIEQALGSLALPLLPPSQKPNK